MRVAAGIHTVGGHSAHGDQNDLLRWYAGFDNAPPVWLLHGEPRAAGALAARFAARGVAVTVAQPGQRLDLGSPVAGAGAGGDPVDLATAPP